jgi:hemerythrin-like domain-containing protein
MMTIIESLTAEHGVFETLFEQIETLLPELKTLNEAKLLGRLLEGLLAGHGEREENLAYAALDQLLADRGQLDRLYQDHQEMDKQFGELKAATSLSDARQRLLNLLMAARLHFKREEQLIFPKLKVAFSQETLARLNGAGLTHELA